MHYYCNMLIVVNVVDLHYFKLSNGTGKIQRAKLNLIKFRFLSLYSKMLYPLFLLFTL